MITFSNSPTGRGHRVPGLVSLSLTHIPGHAQTGMACNSRIIRSHANKFWKSVAQLLHNKHAQLDRRKGILKQKIRDMLSKILWPTGGFYV